MVKNIFKKIDNIMSDHLHICTSITIYNLDMVCVTQALGYKFDDDKFHALVHGTLPYHILKPDLVLRNLLLSMPQRKIVRHRS